VRVGVTPSTNHAATPNRWIHPANRMKGKLECAWIIHPVRGMRFPVADAILRTALREP